VYQKYCPGEAFQTPANINKLTMVQDMSHAQSQISEILSCGPCVTLTMKNNYMGTHVKLQEQEYDMM